MKSMKWIAAVGVIALSASLGFAQAPPPEHEGGHGRGGWANRMEFVQMFGDKLNLTEAQRGAIQAIEKTTREKNAAFFETSSQTREQARAAREANDQAKLDALKPTIEAQRAQMKTIHDAEIKEILTVLTGEQAAQFEKIRMEMQSMHGDHPHQQ